MNWSEALDKMRNEGAKVRRINWTGKKFLFYVPTLFFAKRANNGVPTPIFDTLEKEMIIFNPFVAISTKEGTVGYYATTQCDMLADDWIEYKDE